VCILEDIDTKQILINVSHFEQAAVLVIKYLLYHELATNVSDYLARKYEKVIYSTFKGRMKEDV
jgi:hypothetical protein